MAVDPNIAMSFRGVELPNQLAQFSQMAQLRNADMQAQQMQMQMDRLRRTDEAMERIRQTAVKNGGPGDLNEIAQAFMQSPDLGHQELGLKIIQQQKDKAEFNQTARSLYPDMFGDRAAPVNALAATSAEPVTPAAPANALAPTAPVAASAANALAATSGLTGKTADQLRREIMLFGGMSDPRAKAMTTVLTEQLKEAVKQPPDVATMRALGFPITQAGYAAFREAQRQDRLLTPEEEAQKVRIAGAGAARAITHVNTQLPASEEAQKEFMKEMRQTYSSLKQAPQVLQNIDAAKKLIPQAKGFMGAGGEPLLQVASFLNNRLGMNIDTKGIEGTEELRSRLFLGILDNLKKLDSQPSQQQQEALKIALGSINTDPNALPRVLNVFEEAIRTKVDLHNKEAQDAETRGVKFPYNPKIALPEKLQQGAGASGLSAAEQAELDQLRARFRKK